MNPLYVGVAFSNSWIIVLAAALVLGIPLLLATAKVMREVGRRRRVRTTYSDPAVQRLIITRQVWQGMSEHQLFDSWGKPTQVTTQVLKTKVKKTYRFENIRGAPSAYLDGDVVTGWRQTKRH